MDSNVISLIAFACIFGGGLAGLALARVLPDHHRDHDTRDVIRLGMGMISVLASLVLGLLIASAKSSFDHTNDSLRSYSADLIELDRTLRDYGPGAEHVRGLLLRYADRAIHDTWANQTPDRRKPIEDSLSSNRLENVQQAILALTPDSDNQRWLRTHALEISSQLIHTRWLLLVSYEGTISPVLFGILITWITLIFISFGAHAPRNGAVVVTFFVCALAIGGSIYVIIEMDTPLDGVIAVPSSPMLDALAHLKR
jgi:hypothetical protein